MAALVPPSHVGNDASRVVPGSDPTGQVEGFGAIATYNADGESDGDDIVAYISLDQITPEDLEPGRLGLVPHGKKKNFHLDEVEDGVYFAWVPSVYTEEDDGGFACARIEDDYWIQVVPLQYSDFKSDPRKIPEKELGTTFSVEQCLAIASDERLGLTTTQDTIDAGEKVKNWINPSTGEKNE